FLNRPRPALREGFFHKRPRLAGAPPQKPQPANHRQYPKPVSNPSEGGGDRKTCLLQQVFKIGQDAIEKLQAFTHPRVRKPSCPSPSRGTRLRFWPGLPAGPAVHGSCGGLPPKSSAREPVFGISGSDIA